MYQPRIGIMALLCLMLGSALWATQIPVTVNAPRAGLLSLGVYDASGKLIRSLAYAKAVKAGPQTFTWDATNDLGVPVAPGTYQVRGVSFLAGPKINYRMKVGLSGTPPYATKDGTGEWGGNLGAPTDICSDGTQLIGVFQCVESNYNTGLQRMDATGKIISRYYSFFPWDVRFAGVMDTQNFYLAVADLGAKRLVIGKYNLNEPRGRILTDIPGGDQVAAQGRWAGRWTTDVRGIAVANGRLYVPVLPTNMLYIVDANSGKILQSVAIPSPRGVTVNDGQVYLLSEQKLLRLDTDGKVLGTVIDGGLDNPNDVTMDAAGNFYISDGMHSIFLNALAEGAQANQVKVFSPQGTLLRKIGIDGGRPANGRYTPKGMLNPRGICLGPNGTLWVAEYEEAFQRLSVWDAQSGALKNEFFNTRISAGQGQLSPDRNEMIFNYDSFSDAPGINGYTVNVAKGTWYPAWSYEQPYSTMAQGDVFRGFLHGGYPLSTHPSDGGDDPRFGGGWPYLSFAGDMVKGTNGHTYILNNEGSIWLFDDKAHAPKLAALVYPHRAYKAEDGKRYLGDYDQGPNNWFAWSDLNGDAKMAMDECQLTVNQPLMGKSPRPFGIQLQPDLSIMMICPENQPDRTFKYAVRRLPAKSVLPSGVPVYDWADLQDVVMLQVPSFVGGDGWKGGNNAFVGGINVHDGVIDTYMEPWADAHLRLPGIDGDGWWASRNWRQTPLRFDAKTGAQIGWLKLGRRAPGRAKPGEMYYPRMAGAVDHALFVPDTFSQMWVWTDTGLYLGKLYHEQWEGIYDPDSIFVELTNAYVYKVNGKIYAATGDHGVSVHEVTLPTLTPVTGKPILLTAQQAHAATPWDPDGPAPTKKPSYMAQSIYDYQSKTAVRAITVDGVLDQAEWGNVPSITITRAEKPVAQVRAVWDQEKLYLAYTVRDAVGLKNAGTELPNCPFVSGSYVDFCLGADWNTPNRDNNLAGDVRVILAKITGAQPQDYQMGYWPLKPGGVNPQTIKSPAASRAFSEIAPLAGLTFATRPTADGYTLEVSVPFTSLNLDPFKSLTVGFDASVAFANTAGTLRIEAAHWAGMSEANVVDRPGSSALVPATWGALTFDRTPVRALPQQ